VWLMQLKAQTTTRVILAVSAGALKSIVAVYTRFRSGLTLTFIVVL